MGTDRFRSRLPRGWPGEGFPEALLACPRCRAGFSLTKEVLCPVCGARYPWRGGVLDLRAYGERPHLCLANALPPVARLYDLWRARSTALLSGGRLSFAQELDRMRAWLLHAGPPFLDVGTGTGVYRQALGVGVVVDAFHHALNPGRLSLKEALALAFSTWRGRPKVHLSSQDPGKRPGAHAFFVAREDWERLLGALPGPADLMLEAKGKERALEPVLDKRGA